MSRKIGFGDTYFDPDIDGDIDFDFFGGATTTAASVPDAAVEGAGAAAKVNPFVPSNSDQITQNNNSYNSYTMNDNRLADTRIPSENSERQQVPEFEIRNLGVRKMEDEEAIDDGERTKIGENPLDNENFTINTQHAMYTNHSSTSQLIGDTENAEGDEGERVQNMKTEPSAERDQRNGDDEDEPVFSECDDSASDLFSDEDSFEESEEEYLDSDITEVSPLSSANMSPLPESPRRTPDPRLKRQLLKNHSLSASPKLGVRRMKGEINGRSSAPPSGSSNGIRKSTKGSSGTSSCSGSESGHDTVDLNELARAIRDLEEERKRNGSERSFKERQHSSASYARPRKNMTFTNDEVRRIDHENKRLLRRIIDSQKPRRPQTHAAHYGGRVASSAINRVKELRKIETENLVLLKRLQAAKPTKELSREFLLGSTPKSTTPSIPESKSSFSLTTATTQGGGTRGRTSRCHSTGSLNSSSVTLGVSWNGSGISTPSAAKHRPLKSTKGITTAAATNGSIANER